MSIRICYTSSYYGKEERVDHANDLGTKNLVGISDEGGGDGDYLS